MRERSPRRERGRSGRGRRGGRGTISAAEGTSEEWPCLSLPRSMQVLVFPIPSIPLSLSHSPPLSPHLLIGLSHAPAAVCLLALVEEEVAENGVGCGLPEDERSNGHHENTVGHQRPPAAERVKHASPHKSRDLTSDL